MARSLDCDGQPALVLGAGPALSTALDLAPLRDVAMQNAHVLVVNDVSLLDAELAHTANGSESASPTLGAIVVVATVGPTTSCARWSRTGVAATRA